MEIECTISTPQFEGNKVCYYHKQTGYFDTETLLFEPYKGIFGNWVSGDHSVQFSSISQYNKACKCKKIKRSIIEIIKQWL